MVSDETRTLITNLYGGLVEPVRRACASVPAHLAERVRGCESCIAVIAGRVHVWLLTDRDDAQPFELGCVRVDEAVAELADTVLRIGLDALTAEDRTAVLRASRTGAQLGLGLWPADGSVTLIVFPVDGVPRVLGHVEPPAVVMQ